MSVTYKFGGEYLKGQTAILVKGAVESVLDSCSQVQYGEETKSISEETTKTVKDLSGKMAGKGLR